MKMINVAKKYAPRAGFVSALALPFAAQAAEFDAAAGAEGQPHIRAELLPAPIQVIGKNSRGMSQNETFRPGVRPLISVIKMKQQSLAQRT